MEHLFTLELPREARPQLTEIQQAIAAIPGVSDSGQLATRSLDPATIGVWIQTIGSAAGVATSVVSVLTSVFGLVRRKEIKGARLKVDGMEIELAEISVEDFEKLVTKLTTARGGA